MDACAPKYSCLCWLLPELRGLHTFFSSAKQVHCKSEGPRLQSCDTRFLFVQVRGSWLQTWEHVQLLQPSQVLCCSL